jgi:endonuclease/exonuclease/phosphatase family metal-dependent hydrolase
LLAQTNFLTCEATNISNESQISECPIGGSLQIINMNVASGIKGVNSGGRCTVDNFGDSVETTIISQRKYLGKLAIEAHRRGFQEQLFLFQQIDEGTTRTGGWDMPSYFADRLNRYYMEPNNIDWNWTSHFSGIPYNGGNYGLASAYSGDSDAIETHNHAAVYDNFNKVFESRVLTINGEKFVIINLHLTYKSPPGTIVQLTEILNYIDASHSGLNAIIVGDYNIRKDGLHRTECPTSQSCPDETQAYESMVALFAANQYEEIGGFNGPCWESDLCTFKSSGQDYSRLDYAFIRRSNPNINATATVERPYIDMHCILTDHYTLKIDLSWL